MSSSKSSAAEGVSPLLHGARARAGVQALADRLGAAGVPARVFGHPARLPGDGNVLVAAGAALLSALSGLAWPELGRLAGVGAVAVAVLLLAGLELWPRVPAWTVVVGQPGPAVRRLAVLALDRRHPRRWLFVTATVSAAFVVLAPGSLLSLLGALAACAACWTARGRPRELSLDAALEWAQRRAPSADTLILVSTAASAFGEGVACVVDWYQLEGAKLRVEIDEEVPTGVEDRLRAEGIGAVAVEEPHVVAADQLRG